LHGQRAAERHQELLLVSVCIQSQRYRAAVADARNFSSEHPNASHSRLLLAGLGDFPEAVDELERAFSVQRQRAPGLASRRAGRPRLRRSHTSLLPHIDLGGTRVTDLAERLGVSKQAASQLVDDLEAIGVKSASTAITTGVRSPFTMVVKASPSAATEPSPGTRRRCSPRPPG
jgi:hypothetical protein